MTLTEPSLGLGPWRASARRQAEVVASVDEAEAGAFAGLPDEVAWLRLEGQGRPPLGLRGHFPGGIILACSRLVEDSTARREAILRSAAAYDLVELDVDRDLSEDVLAAIPPARRLVSWRGAAA